ncbi:hypothetical protein K501DRAFT_61839 [Backusella circina FSU 941]|nr:hypothetical protein K501DRAFT_61839 [Backusella circina FSU 941]
MLLKIVEKALTLLINETDDIIRESREKELKQMQDQYETYIVEKASMEKESSIKDQNIESLKQDLVRLQSSPKHLQKESKTLIDLMEDNHKKDKDLLTKELINTKERIIGLQHGLNNKEQVLLSIEDKMDALRQSLSRNKVLKESKAKLERELKGRDSKMASLEQEIQVLQDESKQSINEDSDIVDLLKNIIQSRENEIELVKENSQLLLLQEAQRAALLEKENRELKMKIQECGEHDADNRKNDSVRIKMEKIEQDDDDAIRKRRRLASDTF